MSLTEIPIGGRKFHVDEDDELFEIDFGTSVVPAGGGAGTRLRITNDQDEPYAIRVWASGVYDAWSYPSTDIQAPDRSHTAFVSKHTPDSVDFQTNTSHFRFWSSTSGVDFYFQASELHIARKSLTRPITGNLLRGQL